MSGGQFDWGGRLQNCNGGARRFPQPDWKPGVECNGTRELDCDTDEYPGILRCSSIWPDFTKAACFAAVFCGVQFTLGPL